MVTPGLLDALQGVAEAYPALPILADSRRGLGGWPSVDFKMNAAELSAMLGRAEVSAIDDVKRAAVELADRNGRPVFITLAERGIVAATPGEAAEHAPALPVRGPIDVVGAGDSVTANIAAALAAGASIREAVELAVIASSIVVHQIGTTGVARVENLAALFDQIHS